MNQNLYESLIKNKKILLLICLIILIVVFVIYYFLFIKQDASKEKPESNLLQEISKEIYVGNSSAKISKTRTRYLSADSTKILEYDFSKGTEKEIYSLGNIKIDEVVWSSNMNYLIIHILQDQNSYYKYINLEKSESIKLNKNIKSITFSPEGDKIAYWYFDPAGNNTLSVANSDGKEFKVLYVFPLDCKKVDLYWIKQNIYFFCSSSNTLFKIKADLSQSQAKEIYQGLFKIYPSLEGNFSLASKDNKLGIFDTKKDLFTEINVTVYIKSFYYIDTKYIIVSAARAPDAYATLIYLINLDNKKINEIPTQFNCKGPCAGLGYDLQNLFYNKSTKELYLTFRSSLFKIKLDLDKYL